LDINKVNLNNESLLIDTVKIPLNVKKVFELIEMLSNKLKKGQQIILSEYAIKSNLHCLKSLFALNNFSIQIHNDEHLLKDFVFLIKE
jgi:hypothetical protein